MYTAGGLSVSVGAAVIAEVAAVDAAVVVDPADVDAAVDVPSPNDGAAGVASVLLSAAGAAAGLPPKLKPPVDAVVAVLVVAALAGAELAPNAKPDVAGFASAGLAASAAAPPAPKPKPEDVAGLASDAAPKLKPAGGALDVAALLLASAGAAPKLKPPEVGAAGVALLPAPKLKPAGGALDVAPKLKPPPGAADVDVDVDAADVAGAAAPKLKPPPEPPLVCPKLKDMAASAEVDGVRGGCLCSGMRHALDQCLRYGMNGDAAAWDWGVGKKFSLHLIPHARRRDERERAFGRERQCVDATTAAARCARVRTEEEVGRGSDGVLGAAAGLQCGEPKKGHVCPLVPSNYKCNRCGLSKKSCTCSGRRQKRAGIVACGAGLADAQVLRSADNADHWRAGGDG
ncbi:unnamed protein product [Phytophthora fragariaefolia]|uniref:Unnamed protein product n=1 Tax=Phytophthora fragariaefolia TaxID=1490495 RepID=A0A9W6TPK5_9STRA|nr:unnamed protein product [Phytophthora fragariaefolia]